VLLALTDHLRCTVPHAESWLVARADQVQAGRMVEGVLGCPVCQMEHEVRRGVLHWSAAPGASARAESGSTSPHAPAAEADAETVTRIGALLGFGESTAPFVLTGPSAAAAVGLLGLADAVLVLLDPPDDAAVAFATIIRGAPRVPLAARSTRGVLLDGDWATADQASAAVETLADGGRLVAPVSVPLPAGVRELARDDRQWVAERVAGLVGGGVPIPLRRAAR